MLTTGFGVVAAGTMVLAYGLETRHVLWVAVFAVGCFATALYGAVTEAWVFAILETLWGGIALVRFKRRQAQSN